MTNNMQQFKRSRLERKVDDQITKKTIVLGLITIAIFVFLVVFGLPFLVRFSIFLGEAKNRNAEDQNENILPPLPPRVFVPYEATNSARIQISGLSEPKVKVELLRDDILMGTQETNDSGDFSFVDIELSEGTNQFFARAIGEKGVTSEMSKPLEVEYDNVLPELTMLNPSEDNITVDYADFDIVGQSNEKKVSATVNGRVAMLDSEGKFKLKLQLTPGKNDIEVMVRDMAGNEAKKKITITYDI